MKHDAIRVEWLISLAKKKADIEENRQILPCAVLLHLTSIVSMHGRVRKGDFVALQLLSDFIKVVEVVPDTYVISGFGNEY